MQHLTTLLDRRAPLGTITRCAVWGGLLHVDHDDVGWLRVTLDDVQATFGRSVRRQLESEAEAAGEPIDGAAFLPWLGQVANLAAFQLGVSPAEFTALTPDWPSADWFDAKVPPRVAASRLRAAHRRGVPA